MVMTNNKKYWNKKDNYYCMKEFNNEDKIENKLLKLIKTYYYFMYDLIKHIKHGRNRSVKKQQNINGLDNLQSNVWYA